HVDLCLDLCCFLHGHDRPSFPSSSPTRLSSVLCSDEFLASADRMLQSSEPVFVVGKFDHHGKWMDGWETRRKRGPGHDTAVIRRSEEHTSELQSREKLVCRLLREKKKKFVRNIL